MVNLAAEDYGTWYELSRNVDFNKICVVCATPPCPPFSSMARKNGLADIRGTLIITALQLIAYIRPPMFIIEEVANLIDIHQGQDLRVVLATASRCGYRTLVLVGNASTLVPQRRRSCFIIGIRRDLYLQFEHVGVTRLLTRRWLAIPPTLQTWGVPVADQLLTESEKLHTVWTPQQWDLYTDRRLLTKGYARFINGCTIAETVVKCVGKGQDLPFDLLLKGGLVGQGVRRDGVLPRWRSARELGAICGFPIQIAKYFDESDAGAFFGNCVVPLQMYAAIGPLAQAMRLIL